MQRLRGLLVLGSQLHTRTKGASDAEHSEPAKTTPEDHAMPRSPNAVLSLLPASPKAVGSQASAEMCHGSRGPAHQTSRKRVYVEREEDVVLPSGECSRPHGSASAAVSDQRFMRPRPLTQGPGRTAPNRTHTACLLRSRSVPTEEARVRATRPPRGWLGGRAKAPPNRRATRSYHTTKATAQSPQVSVFACDQTPIQSAIHQPKELGALKSLSLLPPKRSHNTMKACNQCNQQMSMQRHHLQLPGIPAARARSLGQRSLSQLSASSEPRKASVYACCKKWCHPQKHQPPAWRRTNLPSCLPPTPASLHHTPPAPSRTDRPLLPRRATASARLARGLTLHQRTTIVWRRNQTKGFH